MKPRFLPLRRAFRATPPARWTAMPAVTGMEVVLPIVRDPKKYASIRLDMAEWPASWPASWPKPAAQFLPIADFTGLADQLKAEAAKTGYTAHPRIYMHDIGPERVVVRLSRPASRQPRPIGPKLAAALDKPARPA